MYHEEGVCGFNLVFDHFQLCKLYTMFSLYPNENEIPENIINELALLEPQARDGLCLKPQKAVDIMLHARKGPYQSLMARSDIKIKKVPIALAPQLAEELEKRVKLKDIYFAKYKDRYAKRWHIEEIEDEPDFRNIVLRFRASSGLKALAVDALNIKDDLYLYDDIALGSNLFPEEYGWAPYALAIAPNYLKTKNWKRSWPDLIRIHIGHWNTAKYARIYAENDVKYTRELYKYFGCPESDDDSILACAVAASRWRGFAVDIPKLKILREEAIKVANSAPKSPNEVKRYVLDLLNETERIGLQDDSTGKKILEVIAEFEIEDINGNKIPHPAAIKAQEVIDARTSEKEVQNADKLIIAGRFHADFNIIGTLSSRMSGSSGLNAQGIKSTKDVRRCFPLHFDNNVLSIGDFDSFEVSLADAAYNDPILREDLLNGKSIHAIFGSFVYSPMNYEEILGTKGTKNDKYKTSKNCLFSMLYGGTEYTMETKYGVSKENAEKGYNLFLKRYPTVARKRKEIQDLFCSLVQKEIHGKVDWHTPTEYVETLFGSRRYYTLENMICKALYDLAEKPPKEWLRLKIKTVRRDREQTVSGAVRSALLAAAFTIQGSNMRSAGNNRIQGSGAIITKKLQRRIWDIQPFGIHEWLVQTLNVHDEVACCHKSELTTRIKETVNNFIEEIKSIVPLLAMNWKVNVDSWGDK